MPEPASADLWTLSDLCTPWCVHVVATLRIANHLAAGITQIGPLAMVAGCAAGVLDSVLDHLVSKGLFSVPAPGHFALNDADQGLLEPAGLIGLDLDGIGGRFAHAWGTLLGYVRTGRPVYHERFGPPFCDDLDSHPDLAASFDALIGPTGHGTPDPNFQITDGWDGVRTMVDVGGGTGALLAEILRARPALRGTLVDQPRTVALAPAIFQAAAMPNPCW
jgi:2,7-dihydroxy-5-methyl-1-naphthoate 7-O-methyltransferase